MKILKNFLPLLSIVCLAFLLQNCRKGCDNGGKEKEYKISEDDLAKIPYKGFESLTFVQTTIGDTHTFIGDGWKQYWGLTNSDDECPHPERYEKRQLIFRSTTFPKPISVSIYVHDGTLSTFLEVEFQNKIFLGSPVEVRAPYDLDSLTIQGTDYYGIELFSDFDSSTPVTYKCYYNQQTGIIRLFFENGETWDLLKQ